MEVLIEYLLNVKCENLLNDKISPCPVQLCHGDCGPTRWFLSYTTLAFRVKMKTSVHGTPWSRELFLSFCWHLKNNGFSYVWINTKLLFPQMTLFTVDVINLVCPFNFILDPNSDIEMNLSQYSHSSYYLFVSTLVSRFTRKNICRKIILDSYKSTLGTNCWFSVKSCAKSANPLLCHESNMYDLPESWKSK